MIHTLPKIVGQSGSITRSVGKARSTGTELEVAIRLLDNLSFAANYGYTNAELRAPDVLSGGDVGEALQFVPKHTAYAVAGDAARRCELCASRRRSEA